MGSVYLYGIVKATNEVAFTVPGVDGVSPVYMVAGDGLGCVVSDYRGHEFGALSKEEVVRRLLAHQQVVEHVMQNHPVLPVKFGTVLAAVAEVERLLCQGRRRFAEALGRIRGRVELEVAATWDTSQVLAELGKEDEIVRAREAAAALPVAEVVRLGKLVKAAMDRRRDAYREQMIALLQPLALEVQSNLLLSDQLVMNVAFLVEKDQQEAFDRRVQQLDNLFDNQINFRVIGPLPPYSFSTVEVARPSWDELESARRAFHLGEAVSEPGVRKAYRELAARSHPDLHLGDGAATESFGRLRQAADVLSAYCRGMADPADTERTYPLTRDAIERSFLIAIKRSAVEDIEASRFGGLGTPALLGGVHGPAG